MTDYAEFDEQKLKEIDSIVEGGVVIESQLIALAHWMHRNYGATMNQALKTVIPVKQKIKAKEQRIVCLCMDENEAAGQLALYKKKHYVARARL